MIICLRLEHTQKKTSAGLLGPGEEGNKEDGGDELDSTVTSAAGIKAMWETLSRKPRNKVPLSLFSK